MRGVLWGLAAGDLNGGPIRMSVRLAECVTSCGGALLEDRVFQVYYDWFRGPPHDAERAFDTGQTFAGVMKRFREGQPRGEAAAGGSQSAGINAAHRNSCLAYLLLDKERQPVEVSLLASKAKTECQLTHVNQISQECAALSCCIVRNLLLGSTFAQALEAALSTVGPRCLDVKRAVERPQEVMSTGGFAPEVLAAAIHFMSSFFGGEALLKSLQFAGSANYCPVLVGAWLGASGWLVPEEQLRHIPAALRQRIAALENGIK